MHNLYIKHSVWMRIRFALLRFIKKYIRIVSRFFYSHMGRVIFGSVVAASIVVGLGISTLFHNQPQVHPILLTTSAGEKIALTDTSALYMPFMDNVGQIDKVEVKYLSSVPSGSVYVEDGQLVYNIGHLLAQSENGNDQEQFQGATSIDTENDVQSSDSFDALRQGNEPVQRFKGLAFAEKVLDENNNVIPFSPIGENDARAKASYFTGEDEQQWHNNITTHNTLNLGQIYNRIGLHLRSYGNNIEKLFLVEPGGYAGQIAMQLEGIDGINVTENGELTIKNGDVALSFTKPVAYQMIDGQKEYVATRYAIKDHEKKIYGFDVGTYDTNKPLIIDPLVSSTYLGGSGEDHYAYNDFGGQFYTGRKSMVEDVDGSIYVIGYSQSSNYPTTLGAYDDTYNDLTAPLPNDIVISKFNADLTQLLASTYIGGNSEDVGAALALDDNSVYITGFTRSYDFPTTAGASDRTYNGGDNDIFVSKLTKDLGTLTASTYLGGSAKDYSYSLIKSGTNVYVAGDTESYNFPVVTGSYDTQKNGVSDAFVFSFADDLSHTIAGTFVGGAQDDYARAMVSDSAGNVFLTGFTTSTDFPANTNGLSNHGSTDGYVARLRADLTSLTHATYIGGAYTDRLTAIVANSDDDIVVAGSTNSTDIAANGYQKTKKGGYDAVAFVLSNNLGQFKGTTYLGGDNQEVVYDVDVDDADNIFIVGATQSNNFPTDQYAWSTTLGGITDGFVAQLSKELGGVNYATYFGGAGSVDHVFSAMVTNDDQDVLLYGITNSSDFPTTSTAYDQSLNGERDVFVSRITKDLRRNSWPDHLTVTIPTGENAVTITAGQSQNILITAKDPLNRTVESLNGNYSVTVSGASTSSIGRKPLCNGTQFGTAMTLTFVNGVATCGAELFTAENASVDAEVTINSVKYTSLTGDAYDLDFLVQAGQPSNLGSSINAILNPATVTHTVNLTLTANDQYGNFTSQGGGNVVFTVSGATNTTVNGTDQGNGTYTAQYTASQTIGEDVITATFNGQLVARDADGTPDGAFRLPLKSDAANRIVVRYERNDGSLADSVTSVAGQPVKLVISVKDQYDNNVTDYDGSHNITFSPGSISPYSNRSYVGSGYYPIGSVTQLYFTDGVAKSTAYFFTPQTIQLEATDGQVSTNASDVYDLDTVITIAPLNHFTITGSATQVAGQSQVVTITARDQYGNIFTDYAGDHSITFLGAELSPNGTASTAKNKNNVSINFGSSTVLDFVSGQVTTDMTLYKMTNVEVDVTDGSYNSASSSNYDLNVKVNSSGVASAVESTLSYTRDPIYTNSQAGVLVTTKDAYGNQLERGLHSVIVTIAGANTALVTATDKSDGTYLAVYTPTNTGTDIATATVNGNMIQKDTEGTSDGSYHITVNAGISNVRHWDGSASTDWFNAANWAENVVPDTSSTVVIDGNIQALGYHYQPTVNSSGKTVTIAGLDLGSGTDPNATNSTLTMQYVGLNNALTVTGNVHIGPRGTLAHTGNTNLLEHTVNMRIGGNMTIDSGGRINLSGLGYSANNGPGKATSSCGAGHGGVGSAISICTSPNVAYDNLFDPSDLGSGSSAGGGGLLRMNVDGNVTNNGTISCDGSSSGSGGSITVYANNIGGSGTFTANGSQGGSLYGGGGRIAFYYHDYTLGQTPLATGAGSSDFAGAGTVYLRDLDESNGTLVVDNGSTYTGVTSIASTPQYVPAFAQQTQSPTFKKIIVRRNAVFEINQSATFNLDPSVTQIDGDSMGTIMNRGTINMPEIANVVAPIGCISNEGAINGLKNLTLSGGVDLCPSSRGTTQYPLDLSMSTGSGMEFYDFTTASTPFFLQKLTIGQDGVVTHRANSTSLQHMINLEVATDLTIANGGQVNADYKGYASNNGPGVVNGSNCASHGGYGGTYCGYTNPIYGSMTEPVSLGSNAGGGAIKVQVSGTLVNNGVITASGSSGTGGSVWLTANTMSGSGSFKANSSYSSYASGGRVALYYYNSMLSQTPQAYGGNGYYSTSYGGAGTVFIRDLDETNGELIVDNNSTTTSNYTPQYSNQTDQLNKDMTFKNIKVRGGAKYLINADATLTVTNPELITGNSTASTITNRGTINLPETTSINTNMGCFYNYGMFNGPRTLNFLGGIDFCPSGSGTIQYPMDMTFGNLSGMEMSDYTPTKSLTVQSVTVNNDGFITHPTNNTTQQHMINLDVIGDMTLNSGATINVDGKGYTANAGPGGVGSYVSYLGASYGGVGARTSASYTYLPAYGSIAEPVDLGSSSGGGAIKIHSGGNFVNNGSISTNGTTSSNYRGTGGSIWISTLSEISGSGIMEAVGNYMSGGGRIALYYANSSLTQTPHAYGAAYGGGAGTVYVKDVDDDNGSLIIDNNNYYYSSYPTPPTPQYTDGYDHQNQNMTFKSIDIRGKAQFVINSGATTAFTGSSEFTGDSTGTCTNNGEVTLPHTSTTWDALPLLGFYNNGTVSGVEDFTITNGTKFYQDHSGSLGEVKSVTIGSGATMELSNYSIDDPLTLDDLTIQAGGTLTHTANTNTQNHVINLIVDDMTIDATGKIDATGRGYAIFSGPGAPTGSSGAGYGGNGGAGNSGTPGSSYGIRTYPIDLGSGGSGSAGAANYGGGAIKMQVNNDLNVNGTIQADASSNAGTSKNGSGGSILINTKNFNGTGMITANGVQPINTSYGAGAGGRIAVYFERQSFIDSGGSISEAGQIKDPIAFNTAQKGTLYISSPDHYQITGLNTQDAGTEQEITISLMDANGNPYITTGEKQLIFSGASPSFNGTFATTEDKFGNRVNFGDVVVLDFVDGIVTTKMVLYAQEEAEIEVSDGSFDSLADPNYDLNVLVSAPTAGEGYTTISAAPSPSKIPNAIIITITVHDQWGNVIKTGGDTITLAISGEATGAIDPILDNNNGTYNASYTPPRPGAYQITGTINGQPIQRDTDGTSDGIYYQTVTGGDPHHFVVTGDAAQVAGQAQTITITARDVQGYLSEQYEGNKTVYMSGPTAAPAGTMPICRDNNGNSIAIGSPMIVTFTQGVATMSCSSYHAESVSVDASDGTIDSAGSIDYDLDVTVSRAAACHGTVSYTPASVYVSDAVALAIHDLTDIYGNAIANGGDAAAQVVTGSNAQTLTVQDKGDGTYESTYTPTNSGTDHIATTMNTTCSLNSVNIVVGALPNPSCGTAAKAYVFDATDFDGTLCAIGTEDHTPAFPTPGNSVSWDCVGYSSTITCSASHAAAVAPTCGDAARNYTYPETAFDGGMCGIGTVELSPSFPQPGHTSSWHCLNNGLSTTCDAQRDAPTPPVCGAAAAIYNYTDSVFAGAFCTVGVPDATPTYPDAGETVNWHCLNHDLSVGCYASRGVSTGGSDDPQCGSAEQTYLAEETAFIGSFCSAGTVVSEPIFPGQGAYANWTCTLNGKDANCEAYRRTESTTATDSPSCGSAEQTYFASDTEFIGKFCALGTVVSEPNFPAKGEYAHWTCLFDGKEIECDAYRRVLDLDDGEGDDEEEENEIDCNTKGIKDVTEKTVVIKIKLSDEELADSRRDFEVDAEDLATGSKTTQLVIARISDDGKANLTVTNLTEDTNYRFKVYARGREEYFYCDKSITAKTLAGNSISPLEDDVTPADDTTPPTDPSDDDTDGTVKADSTVIIGPTQSEDVQTKDATATLSTEHTVIQENVYNTNESAQPSDDQQKESWTQMLTNGVSEHPLSAQVAGFGGLVAAALAPLLSAMQSAPFVLKDLFRLPLFGIFARRKGRNGWGVVFEDKTKQPLPGIAVTLHDPDGNVVETAYTDQAGRYGFFPKAGEYVIKIDNKHFVLNTVATDPLYGATYPGGKIVANGSDVVTYNLSLAPNGYDWEDYAKNRARRYHVLKWQQRALSFLYYVGLVWTVIAAVVNPNVINGILLVVYVGFFIYDHLISRKNYGTITQRDGAPVPFALVALNNPFTKGRERFAVSNGQGKYYLLAENKIYDLSVSGTLLDNTTFKHEGTIEVHKGIVKKDWEI